MPTRTLACLALAVLTGCSATPAAVGTPPAKQDKRHQIEATQADCMKQKGFRYVPYTQKMDLPEQRKKAFTGDYAAMKAERTKYGFFVFAAFVYPKEMNSPAVKPDNPDIDPNWAILNALSPAQRKAYQKASTACELDAITKVTGRRVTSLQDWTTQMDEAIKARTERELDGDPKIVEPAAAMADCLKAKGYRIDSNKPTALEDRGRVAFEAQKTEIAKNDDIPDTGLEKGQYFEPTNLTPDEARPYLNKEVKAALDDLECGKDFYATYLPRADEIERQINAEFGMFV